MKEFFISLRDELMPETPKRPNADEVAELRIARHKRLERARWELLKEGHGKEPSVRDIYDRAWGQNEVS